MACSMRSAPSSSSRRSSKHKPRVPLSPAFSQGKPAYGWKGNDSSIYKAHKTLLESRAADVPTLTTMQLTRGGARFIPYAKHYKKRTTTTLGVF